MIERSTPLIARDIDTRVVYHIGFLEDTFRLNWRSLDLVFFLLVES